MANDLEEKFVADDGVSTVAEPVTPAGGEVKKKKADVKKAVDPKTDEIEDSEIAPGQKKVAEEVEDISIDESIESMFEGMDLSEDFKSKVTLVFESAVNEAAAIKVEQVKTDLEEQFEAELQEAVSESIDGIVENLDSYLDYVVGEWMEENELAIEAGIKVEMAESLMDGLRDLFTEHNIEVDDETIDVVAGLEEEIENMKTEYNNTVNENIELSKTVVALEADRVFNEMTEGLTVSQRERLRTLSENLDASDIDSYTSNLETLKESFFKKSTQTISEDTEEDEIITEEKTNLPKSQHSTINALVEALDARNSKK